MLCILVFAVLPILPYAYLTEKNPELFSLVSATLEIEFATQFFIAHYSSDLSTRAGCARAFNFIQAQLFCIDKP